VSIESCSDVAMQSFRGLGFALLISACSSSNSGSPPPPTLDADDGASTETIAEDTAPAEDTSPPTGTAGTFNKSATVDSVKRTWVLYVPDSAMTAMADGPVPLLVGLHGAGDTGANFITGTALKTLASKRAFVLAAPNAVNKAWALATSEGWTSPDGHSSSLHNDFALVKWIVDDTKAAYRIDTKKMFACGFSRGAGFTGGLATASNNTTIKGYDWSSPFAAYAVDAGYDMFSGTTGFGLDAGDPKRPIWLIHGTSDTGVPYSSGKKFADGLTAAGWPATFTSITGAPHAWLFQPAYGHSNDELWDWFLASSL